MSIGLPENSASDQKENALSAVDLPFCIPSGDVRPTVENDKKVNCIFSDEGGVVAGYFFFRLQQNGFR